MTAAVRLETPREVRAGTAVQDQPHIPLGPGDRVGGIVQGQHEKVLYPHAMRDSIGLGIRKSSDGGRAG